MILGKIVASQFPQNATNPPWFTVESKSLAGAGAGASATAAWCSIALLACKWPQL